jgi:NAD(P)-dependent dehydrogenase (short-subunit alcohol dehydrogenase family)
VTAGLPVAVVTGGGAGIGAAVAEALGREGWHVVTVDPLVTLDGAERLPETDDTTAGRIVAAGGSAQASSASVTDGDALRSLFADLVAEHGGIDAVVNVAGITRPTGFAKGSEADWQGVLEVHLDGYRNVLAAALPIMAAAGRGRIVGVTSGSGWRAADAGAYSCAKRAVAALTWQLGRRPPAGVSVNAMSPIAVTRMVTEALAKAKAAGGGQGLEAGSGGGDRKSSGGLSLLAMPAPDELGPLGAHLASEAFAWCSGQIVFAGGPEVAVVEAPRFLEVLRTDGLASLPAAIEAFTARALVPAEAAQAAGGGSNPRFADLASPGDGASEATTTVRRCAVASDRPELAEAIEAALGARGVDLVAVPLGGAAGSFAGAADALAAVAGDGPIDAVVVAFRGGAPVEAAEPWERTIAEHHGVVEGIQADAAWARAVADLAATDERPIRLVTLTDALTAGGWSRSQAAAQLARAAAGATADRVTAFAVAVEQPHDAPTAVAGELAAHLVAGADVDGLAGAELATGVGWIGLRSHPRPVGSIVLGGGELPVWFDEAIRQVVDGR